MSNTNDLRNGATCQIDRIWTFSIIEWMPTPLNRLLNVHWAVRRKLKKYDQELVFYHSRHIPKATEKRHVSVVVTLPPKKRAPDPDALFKSLLDAMKHAGLIVNDSHKWCEFDQPQFVRGARLQTVVTLRDV